jgi:acyl carrier protein
VVDYLRLDKDVANIHGRHSLANTLDARPITNSEAWAPLPRHEIEARIYKCVRHHEKINPRQLKWSDNLKNTWAMDSLDTTALLTSIEHEFSVVFHDNFYDRFETLEPVISYLAEESTRAI